MTKPKRRETKRRKEEQGAHKHKVQKKSGESAKCN
jgi:hypothetical protein